MLQFRYNHIYVARDFVHLAGSSDTQVLTYNIAFSHNESDCNFTHNFLAQFWRGSGSGCLPEHRCLPVSYTWVRSLKDIFGWKITLFLREAGGVVHDSSHDFAPKDILTF